MSSVVPESADAPRSAQNASFISLFDLFKIGIGPSSSHTVGPMKAADAFAAALLPRIDDVEAIRVTLFGSLAWTGEGHATDKAVVLGLTGCAPETVNVDDTDAMFAGIKAAGALEIGERRIRFSVETDLVFDHVTACDHPNTMRFEARDSSGAVLCDEMWLSLGGGFIARQGEAVTPPAASATIPFPFASGETLIAMGRQSGRSIAAMMLENEAALRPRAAVLSGIDRLVETMSACIDRGLNVSGHLPGRMKVKRRARKLMEGINAATSDAALSPTRAMECVSAFAIAVNEENAAGGRVVTAPTNGAAGVVPAVLRYYRDFCAGSSKTGVHTFLLAAAAIGSIIKRNASISGAEVGCQGEVGSAASMAAAGLCAALGGTNEQIENAAEIAMEHHLGMTCDPIGGLVQIPCIERNAFGAIKAINAASLALKGDGHHVVSLDQVVATMRQTGADMQSKYKETSQGGLAVNVIEC